MINLPHITKELSHVLNNDNINETHLKTLLEADYHDKIGLKDIIDDFFTPQKKIKYRTNQEKIKNYLRK